VQLDPSSYRNIVVLTGAGASAASGLQTYRGAEGLWQDEDAVNMATAAAWERDPMGVWRVFGAMRQAIREAEPNAAHRALAALETLAGGSVTIITQNIDGLHQRAGSTAVVELHGNLRRTRCSNTECALQAFVDDAAPRVLPLCSACGAPLRPDIVLFHEALPGGEEWHAKRALRDCDLFMAVGTSGTVYPAAGFVRSAEYAGARTMLINLEAMDPPNPAFQEQILGAAEVLLPAILGLGTA